MLRDESFAYIEKNRPRDYYECQIDPYLTAKCWTSWKLPELAIWEFERQRGDLNKNAAIIINIEQLHFKICCAS